MSRDAEATCPFCTHFVDWHQGESFRSSEGPDDDGGWRYRCPCGCRVKLNGDALVLATAGAEGGR